MDVSTPPGIDMPLTSGVNDFVQHSRQPYQIAITSVFLSLAIFAVIVRLWVRKHMINSVGGDDYMMVVAVVSFILYCAALMEIVANGGGTHIRGLEDTRIAQDVSLVSVRRSMVTDKA
jgi:TctA family transporter